MSTVKTVLIKDADTSPVYIYPKTSADMVEYNNESVKNKLDRIKSDVPANAKFTDTTYSIATTSKNGLLSKNDKQKIDNYLKVPQAEGEMGIISYEDKQKIDNYLKEPQAEGEMGIISYEDKQKIDTVANFDPSSISYKDISGKEAKQVEDLSLTFETGLYYQNDPLSINENIILNKGQYFCHVLSDKLKNSGFSYGKIYQIVYIFSGQHAYTTYARHIYISSSGVENTHLDEWKCIQPNIDFSLVTLSAENKIKADTIIENSTYRITDFTNDLSVDYDTLNQTQLINLDNYNQDNLSLDIDKSNSLCIYKLSNGICYVDMKIVLKTNITANFYILPTIKGLPNILPSLINNKSTVKYLNVRNSAKIRHNEDIIKPEIYLPNGNGTDLAINTDKSMFWAYTSVNNVLASTYGDFNDKYTSAVLTTNNNDITIYIDGTIIIQ